MTAAASEMRPPPLSYLVAEAGSMLALRWRSLQALRDPAPPRAKGQPVLVIPGFLASDLSTAVLRRALQDAGYRAYGWSLGVNMGATPERLERLEARLEKLARKGRVTLIGWSLGGLYARELARRRPELVAKVVTLGSPFSGDVRANHAWRLYEMVNGHKVDAPPVEANVREKPPVPTIALWSRRDGIVAPACARGREGEADRTVEIDCTHMGFMSAPCAIEAVLDVLREDRPASAA